MKNLKKKTKEIICIGAVAFVIGSFVFYDVATGVAYAASAGEAQPHVHGLSVQLQEQSGSGSVNVDAKAFNDFSDFVST